MSTGPYKLGKKSQSVYDTLHPKLKLLVDMVLLHVDISLIEGLRPQQKQIEYFVKKLSKLDWPKSKHNKTRDPQLKAIEYKVSDALDLVPYPTAYKDKEQMIYTAGYVIACAHALGIKLRWGGDWNEDTILNNKRNDFFDCWHFEI
ncbi:MAG: hypothetical protein KAR06_12195, partial [Deltaproteobacteria bacterium]|nr:hypothetical protein [Deltaproteobacteria bacterium]